MSNRIIPILTDDKPFNRPNAQEPTSELGRLHAFLNSQPVQSLLRLHPNELATEEASVPREWHEWFNCSSKIPQGWLELVHYYMTGNQGYVRPL